MIKKNIGKKINTAKKIAKVVSSKTRTTNSKKISSKKVAIKKPTTKKNKKPTLKKVVKKIIIKKKEIKEKKLGRVLNYFEKIKVVAIKLKDELSVGDTIRIKGGQDTDFKQKITSIEINGQKIKKAKKNQGIGFKVKEKVRAGYWVYKLIQ
ncbi:hypothetical protein M0R01_02975 [bacterium]|nr:hypothetical protein [bacterium]